MLALECASQLTCRLNLLYDPVRDSDLAAVGEALDDRDSGRCPEGERLALPAAIADLVRRVRRRRDDELLALWAEARDDVADVARRTDAQRLWLVQHARRLLSRRAFHALLGVDRDDVLGLIGCAEVVGETRRQWERGLADNHLHSGAADELGDLLARLVPRVADDGEPRELERAVGTANGQSLNLGPIVLMLAAACAVLDGPEDARADEEHELTDRIWWKKACDAARTAEGIDPSTLRSLRHPLQAHARVHRTPQLAVLYEALEAIAKGERLTPERTQAARRGLIALSLVFALVVIPARSNLGTFVERFNVMRRLRNLFGEDTGRLASALRTMYLDGHVTAVELRKSLVASSERTVTVASVVAAIRADMADHAGAAIAACESLDENELIVRMPLTFTRRDAEPVDTAAEPEGYVPFRPPVGETLAIADAIVQATQEETASRFVGAVDVVGDEKKVPNWLYAIAYCRIAAADTCRLEFACHAGEYFADQLEGLRRIAEVALFVPAVVRRIGHCLALDANRGVESQQTDEAGTLLENVAWLLLVLEGRAETGLGQSAPVPGVRRGLLTELRRALLRLARPVFGSEGVSVADVRRWYVGRFDADAMVAWVPGLEVPSSETRDWPRGMDVGRLPRPTGRVDAMLATSVYSMAFEVRTSSGVERISYDPGVVLPNDLVRSVRDLLAEGSTHALEPVRRWLGRNEVVIEACPSSNAALAKLAITDHPIWRFHSEHGLMCSVNTDDPALFGASLSEEYVHAGMAANGNGGDGGRFVAALADMSREHGMIRQPLCNSSELPIDAYRAVVSIVG